MKKLKLSLKEEQIELEEKDGSTSVYTIRELTGHERETYMTKMGTRMKWAPDGKPAGMASYDGAMTDLVQMSTYGPDGNRVRPDVVKGWPQSVIEYIYETAAELSALGNKESNEKND